MKFRFELRRFLWLAGLVGLLEIATGFAVKFPSESSISATTPGSMDTFHGCPLNGSVTDPYDRKYATNVLKNRYVAPDAAPYHSFSSIKNAKTDDTTLHEDEGITLEGYVGKVIKEEHKKPNGQKYSESCNCDLFGEENVDEHIYLLPTKQAYKRFLATNDKSQVINIETTPRTKALAQQAGYTWTVETLSTLKGHKIRVKGWLLNDWIHANASAADGATGSQVDRATVWEVHPITYFKVLR